MTVTMLASNSPESSVVKWRVPLIILDAHVSPHLYQHIDEGGVALVARQVH